MFIVAIPIDIKERRKYIGNGDESIKVRPNAFRVKVGIYKFVSMKIYSHYLLLIINEMDQTRPYMSITR